MRIFILLISGVLAGCASTGPRAYKPYKSREKKAFGRADRAVNFHDVKTNFQAYAETEVAWAGIIDDIQFKETERTIQVAFDIDYRDFDWKYHKRGNPYRLSAESGGRIKAGWTVDKPARISYLKTLAKPGYMIVVYGRPWDLDDDTIQLAATAVRPIKKRDYDFFPEAGTENKKDFPTDLNRSDLSPDSVLGIPVPQNAPAQNL
ncbi:hypothetical protein [Pontiella agarivorans]|uniref:Lipoprotein n=1 Tax=Pontiella agarivorans TaxID=3038953 RepID=A0ABU5N039_9BACT|nr:hypothetical protein [Pontiella agarivorans]MDZ8119788.1 hypothetical protein [Pontiella agarivorans]